jgi:hypothetical protein
VSDDYRILITGSRTWADREVIRDQIADVILDSGANALGDGVTIVHGACPKGADQMADDVAATWPAATVERHPADWDRHGKRAGFLRNAEMVNLGADVCLAFIHDESKGASMTANLAEKAGIPTRRVTA